MAKDIDITADFSDIIQEFANLQNIQGQARKELEKYIQANVTLDETGNRVRANVQTMISDNQKLVGTWRLLADGAEAYNFTIKQTNNQAAKAAEVARELAKANREQAQAVKEAAAQSEIQARAEQKLRDIQSKANRKEFLSRVTEDSSKAIGANTASERQRLGSLGVDLSADAQARLSVMSRRIAEVGTQAGLSTRQLMKMFDQVRSGDFGNIDGKFSKVVESMRQYEAVIAGERNRLAKAISKPTPGGDGPGPNEGHIAAAAKYLDFVTRIKNTLTNLALYRGFNILTNSLTESVSAARDFDAQIALIRTLSQDAQQSTGAWSQQIKQVSSATGFAMHDVAELFYDVASNQVAAGRGIQDFAKKAADLARITKASPKESGNLLASIVNTFGDDAGSLDEVSAKLFKTIDRGRIVVSDLSNSFGRVAFNAKSLGVTFDETLASLSTFTRGGLTSSDAMTLLTNVFNKLVKPTDKAKQLLASWGFESGKAAVATLGFQGTLLKLIEATQSGKIDVAEFFNEIRGERGFEAFKQSVQGFKTDLDQIANQSKGAFSKAKSIIDESDSAKIAKAMATFKNALTTSFGQAFNSLVAGLVDVNAKTEDFERIAGRTFRLIAAGAAGVGTLVVALRGLAIVSELNVRAKERDLAITALQNAKAAEGLALTRAQAVAEYNLSVARSRAKGTGSLAAFGAANPLLGTATLLIGLAAGYVAYEQAAVGAFNEAGAALDEYLKKLKEEKVTKELEKSLDEVRKIKDEYKEISKVVGTNVADAIQRNNYSLRNVREAIKDSSEAMKTGFAGAIKQSSEHLHDLQREIGEIPNRITNATKQMQNFGDVINQTLNGQEHKYASPAQKESLYLRDVQQIIQRINQLRTVGTKEADQEIDRLSRQVPQLLAQADSARFDFQKQQFTEGLKGTGAEGDITFYYDRTRLEKQLNQFAAFHNQLLKERIALLGDIKKKKEEEALKETDRLNAQKAAIKEFQDFSFTDETGKTKSQYLDANGRFDEKRAKDAFNKVSEKVQNFVGPDVLKNLQFGSIKDQRLNLLTEQAKRLKVEQDLKTTQDGQAKAQENLNKVTEEGIAKTKSYNETAKNTLGTSKNILENLGNAVSPEAAESLRKDAAIKSSGVTQHTKFGRFMSLLSYQLSSETPEEKGVTDTFKDLEGKVNSLKERRKALATTLVDVNGQKIIDPVGLKKLQDDIAELKQEIGNRVSGAAKGVGIENASPSGYIIPGTKSTLDDLDMEIKDTQDKINSAKTNLDQGTAAIQRAKAAVDESSKALQNQSIQYKSLNATAAAVLGGIGEYWANSTERLNAYNNELRKQQELMQNMRGPKEQAALEAASAVLGVAGATRRAYGGPIGHDNIMAWLGEGEYVMNAAATRRFYSQIVNYNNAGRIPRYFNSGGEVTNINGATINVSGAGNPQVIANEVYRMLRRGERLGRF